MVVEQLKPRDVANLSWALAVLDPQDDDNNHVKRDACGDVTTTMMLATTMKNLHDIVNDWIRSVVLVAQQQQQGNW